MYSSQPCVDVSTHFLELVNPLPPSIDIHILYKQSIRCKTLLRVINSLVLSSICRISFILHFKNGPEYLTRGIVQLFTPLMWFLLKVSKDAILQVLFSNWVKWRGLISFFFSSKLVSKVKQNSLIYRITCGGANGFMSFRRARTQLE